LRFVIPFEPMFITTIRTFHFNLHVKVIQP
jgi:hypothetical protein